MYNLVFERKALHALNKLEQKIRERIWNKLQECKGDPFRFFEKLTETPGFNKGRRLQSCSRYSQEKRGDNHS